ncbi:MAG: PriCT-2 domain-containing protein [Rhodospirillaceae bacterium]
MNIQSPPAEIQGRAPAPAEHFSQYAAAGFTPDLVPIAPPNAAVWNPASNFASSLGKVPGKFAGGKWVGFGNYTALTATPEMLEQWRVWPGVGLGIQCRRVVAIDVDVTDAAWADAIRAGIQKKLGRTVERVGRAPKYLRLYRLPAGRTLKKMRVAFTLPGSDTEHAVEVLGTGQQFVAEGLHPKTGRPYAWRGNASPASIGLDHLPEVTPEQVADFMRELQERLAANGCTVKSATHATTNAARDSVDQTSLQAPAAAIIAALKLIPNDLSYDEWLRMTAAVKAAAGEEAYAAYEEWSLQWPDNTPGLVRQKWDSFHSPFKIGAAHVFKAARAFGFNDAVLDFGGTVEQAVQAGTSATLPAQPAASDRVPEPVDPAKLEETLRADPPKLHSPDIAESVARLQQADREAFARLRNKLTAKDGPYKAREFDGAVKRGTTLARAAEVTRAGARAQIHYDPARLYDCIEQVEAAMVRDTERGLVLRYGNALCAVEMTQPITAQDMADENFRSTPRVVPFNLHSLRNRVAQSCEIQKQSSAGLWAPTAYPKELVEGLLATRAGSAAPVLTGVIAAPTVRPDGSLLLTPGYDVATGLFAHFDPAEFPAIPDNPTQADAARAYRYIRTEVFADFRFAEETDAAVAAAALLNVLTCRTLPGDKPLFAFTAPIQASGKTKLAELCAMPVLGRAPEMLSWDADAAEQRKKLVSALLEGHSALLLDNVSDGTVLDSPTLAAMVTSKLFRDRLLGKNRTVEVPTNVTVMFTGNNIQGSKDLTSRTLECYLDPKTENPEHMTYSRDNLPRWALEQRGKIVGACLTLLRAHAGAGRPRMELKPSRFPEWDATIRAALVFAGAADPAAKFLKPLSTDSELAAWADVLAAWHGSRGAVPVATAELADLLSTAGASADFGESAGRLRRALESWLGCAGKAGGTTSQRIGKRLQSYRNRVCASLRLESVFDTHRKVQTWRVVRADN